MVGADSFSVIRPKEMEVSQMKAAVIHEFGDFGVLKHEDIERR